MEPHRMVMAGIVMAVAACGRPGREPAQAKAAGGPNPLLDPQSSEMRASAPASFRARFETGTGSLVVEGTRAWAPPGPDRVYTPAPPGLYAGRGRFPPGTGVR